MSEMRDKCVHGVPGRCSLCKRVGDRDQKLSVTGILLFLNEVQIRATYGAVGEALGVRPENLSAQLRERRPWASSIVSSEDGRPTGYDVEELDPALFRSDEIIRIGSELIRRVRAWRRRDLLDEDSPADVL